MSLTTINKHNLFLRNFKSVSVQIFSSGSHTEREATGRTKGKYKDENLTLYRSKITSLLIEKKRYRKINNVWLLGRQDFHKNVPNSNWNVILEALDEKKSGNQWKPKVYRKFFIVDIQYYFAMTLDTKTN